tara:strand:+ start:885 stop:1070 length:186 start_codon:yes stop_codon:yes gene_type:complete
MNIGDIIDENQKGATNVCPTAMVNVSEETHPISKSNSKKDMSPGGGYQHRTQIFKTYQQQD